MEYEWYADVFLLTNLLMDMSAMFAAALLLNDRLRLGRCLAVCAAGVTGSTVLLILLKKYLIYSIVLHTLIHPLMAFCVFGAKGKGRFLRTLLTIYLILFMMGGIQNSVGMLLGNSTLDILLSGMAAALLFCIYQIRWRVTQRICRVELWAGTEHVMVDAYCDTGNLLRDSLTGKPVCILQQEVFEQFATDRTIQKEISCHTIGTEKEKLKIVMLDKMKIYQKGTVTEIKEPEIGLHTGEIMQNPKVQMLLHASYIR